MGNAASGRTHMIEYKLEYPFDYNGKQIEAISFTVPKAKHFQELDKQNLKEESTRGLRLIEILSGFPEGFAGELTMIDIEGINEALLPYLKKPQAKSGKH